MPEILDPEQLPETQPDGFDPNRNLLSDMGYDGPPTEPEVPDDQSGAEQPDVVGRAKGLKDQLDDAKGTYGKVKEKLGAGSAKKAGKIDPGIEKAKNLKKVPPLSGTGEQTAIKGAGEELVKDVGNAGLKVGGKLGARLIPILGEVLIALDIKKLLTNKKFWTWIVCIIAGILLLIAIPLGLLGGKGSPQYPATQAQQDQITALSAVSGNSISRTKLIFESIIAEKKRMAQFKNWVSQIYGSNAGKASGATARIKEVTSLLDTFEATSVAADKKKIVVQIKEKLSSFSTDFPELVGYGAVNGYPLNVPGVIEAEGGDCGAASILMVSLYYKQTPGNDVYNAPKKASRANICVSPGYLNGHSPYQDWDYATSSKASFASVKKSLAAGNPVILYTKAGGIYGPSAKGFGGKHIVVIVGYDPADQTFFINNPSPKKVDIATKTPNGRKMTESHLQQFLGDGEYNHSYIIRKAFL